MSETVEHPDTPDISLKPSPAKKRGRPTGTKTATPKAKVEKKAETTQQRIDRVEAELLKLKEAKQREDRERDAVIGRVEVARALADADYRKDLSARLRKEITSKAELALVDELLD